MPPLRKRKGKYCQWSEENMREAIAKYKTGKYGLNEICTMYEVPKPTFKRHLAATNKRALNGKKILGRSTVFSVEVEAALEKHILALEEIFFGLTIKDTRRAAFQFAEKNSIKHNFSKKMGMAGKKWYYNFMKRHPNLSLRQPESTSLARCRGFNKKNVTDFFNKLEKIIDENKLDATKIYNVDESGFSTVQKSNQRILAKKGKHQVGTIASGERGVNTTMVVCASASGQFVAPMIIFKRKRMSAELTIGAPPGCLVEISDTGYINSELFVTWLKKFIEVVKPTKENKVLLVLDGHTTHSKNYEAIVLARDNGLIILQLPGHTTHRLQPLDVSVFKPLETYYNQAIEKWLRQHAGMGVTQFHVASLLNEAYGKAVAIVNATNGFRKCGIWPVNRDAFSDADFAPSELLTDKENISIETMPIEILEENSNIREPPQIQVLVDVHRAADDVNTEKIDIQATKNLNVSIEDILPFPDVSEAKKQKMGKSAQTAEIITSTPYKEQLEVKQNAVEEKKKRAVKRNFGVEMSQKPARGKSISKGKKRPKKENSQIQYDLQQPSSSTNKDILVSVNYDKREWYCKICKECLIEDMLQCIRCKEWVHESCADASDNYICDMCS